LIETENLTRKFGDLTAVEGLTISVKEGEVFGFLGPNGAGKTTTVRMLSCLISKTSGEARIGGYDVGNHADSKKIRKIIGLLPENVGLYDELSAYRNLDFYGRLYERNEQHRRERIEHFLKLLGLWDRRDTSVGTFSKGMKQKLAIARALIHDPPGPLPGRADGESGPRSCEDGEGLHSGAKEGEEDYLPQHPQS
jgi:ABC-2 type transport system ATP-binding protein